MYTTAGSPFIGKVGKERYYLTKELVREFLKRKDWVRLSEISKAIGLNPYTLTAYKTKPTTNSQIWLGLQDMIKKGEIETNGKMYRLRSAIPYVGVQKPEIRSAIESTLEEKAQKALENLTGVIIDIAREESKKDLELKDAEIEALRKELKGFKEQKHASLIKQMFNFRNTP